MTQTRVAMDWLGAVVCGLYLHSCLFLSCAVSAVPSAPTNVTLARIFASAALVMWDADSADDITGFEMTIRPLTLVDLTDMTEEIDGQTRSFHVHTLFPETEYQIFISAQNGDGVSNDSDVITFRTLEATAGEYTGELVVNPGEVIIVAFMLVAWFCAIGLFLHKWGTIRIIQSAEPRYKHCPKNLHTIKVVKRSTDSVIYKNYPTQLSKTMVARQKRIARMNTMPNIKVGSDILAEINKPENITEEQQSVDNEVKKNKDKHKFKVFSRTITSPVLEVEEPQSSTA